MHKKHDDIDVEIIPPDGSTAHQGRTRFEKAKEWFKQDFRRRMRLWPLWSVLALYGLSPVLYVIYLINLVLNGEVFWFLISFLLPPLGIIAAYFWLVFDVVIGGLIRLLT